MNLVLRLLTDLELHFHIEDTRSYAALILYSCVHNQIVRFG